MSIIKCKMCGGSIEVEAGARTATCEYCDSLQTIPSISDDKLERLYDRAGHFRRNNEFDKAMGIYEQILDENPRDAESYWSIVLCRYGIQYVEDPQSHKRIPTVNRTQFTSIFDDENYKSALEHADFSQKILYEEEAKVINDIQKGILDISRKEEPFDVFICYKETDENGRRTHDSVYANEIYHELTREGFKVFYARITLEDKLGTAYEPYIFAALHSARVMVVLGTKPEYFNAVWVKNEWSRFLYQIKSGERKTLIPAYKDMDAYDLPEEFAHLQAQDMNKLGFMPDLIRGIGKILGTDSQRIQTASRPVEPTPAPAPSNSRYDVYLVSYRNDKLRCIKTCRECFGWGLTEAKNAVESSSRLLARQVDSQEARRIEQFFGAEGFEIELRSGVAAPAASTWKNTPAEKPKEDIQPLLKRVFIFLEDGDWKNADIYCEKVLDHDPENAQAYVGKLLSSLRLNREEQLAHINTPLGDQPAYRNALRFADEELSSRLVEYDRTVKANIERIEKERQEQKRIDEAKRQEQIRLENQRKQKQAERNHLLSARDNTVRLIEGQVNGINAQKALIEKKSEEVANLSKSRSKAKKLAALTLLLTIVMYAGLIIGVINFEFIAIFVLCFFATMILTGVTARANGNSVGASIGLGFLVYITLGIFPFCYSLRVLFGSAKKRIETLKDELRQLNDQCAKMEGVLKNYRNALSEINHKIEAFDNANT